MSIFRTSASLPRLNGFEPALHPRTNDPGLFFTGTTGNDSQAGTNFDDGFDYSQGGNDTLNAGDGDDFFTMGAEFTPADTINGGAGNDVLMLDGDYFDFVELTATTIVDIEEIDVAAGNTYNLQFDDGNVFNGHLLTIDGTQLGRHDHLFIATQLETNGSFVVLGGAGSDTVLLAQPLNTIMGNGGDDQVNLIGLDLMDDQFYDGGKGADVYVAEVAQAGTVVLSGTNFTNVELLVFQADNINLGLLQVDVTLGDSNLGAKKTLTVQTNDVGGTTIQLTFDGSGETNGHFNIIDGVADDILTGGAKSDTITINDGGADTVHGGAGNDIVNAGNAFSYQGTGADLVDGGIGTDTLRLSGDYSDSATSHDIFLSSAVVHDVEVLELAAGGQYVASVDDTFLSAGSEFTVDGTGLLAGDLFLFDGRAETDGRFKLLGGAGGCALIGGDAADTIKGGGEGDSLFGEGGIDTIDGGAGQDFIKGGLGADQLAGDEGKDHFIYDDVTESTGPEQDALIGFDFLRDKFTLDLPAAVQAIDPTVTAGALSSASFDADLADAMSDGALKRKHAVLFTPDAGTLAGKVFLIVDANATAGYQAGEDYVFRLTNAQHFGALDTGDFIAT